MSSSSPPLTPTRSYHGRTTSTASTTSTSHTLTPVSSHPQRLAHRHRRSSSGMAGAPAGTFSPHTPRLTRTGTYEMANSPSGADGYGYGGDEGGGMGGMSMGAADNGLGNLADELGDSWDEEEDGEGSADEGDFDFGEGGRGSDDEGSIDELTRANGVAGPAAEASRDSGISMNRSSPDPKPLLSPDTPFGPPLGLPLGVRRHKRVGSMYDGSDYGGDSDLESSDGITPGLDKQMSAVESLARRGVEANGSENDGVVARVTDKLRDLGTQSGVESGATRLTTAHTALSTHITHQTRHLLSLNSTIFSPLAPPLDPELVEPIIPLISDTLAAIPHPTYNTLNSLISLSNSTNDLLDTLSLLTDTLHMSRQASLSATRRLRSVKEQLAEWKREQDAAEEGRAYLEQGEWDRKLRDREAGKVCGDVVGGFEAACEGWRRKLVATLEAC